MIKLFEDYENTQYPLFKEVVHTDWDTGVKTKKYKQYDMQILDYVKGILQTQDMMNILLCFMKMILILK